MVFQNYALYPHMTVQENMSFSLEMRKRPKEEIKMRVHEAAEILGIENLLARKPKQLSGGQRQRVAVGRAIVRKPEVFLFDEPLSNLDAKLRVQTRVELKKLHEKLATTAVYVTHDQVEAMTMGDRIVVMKDGLIQQVGGPLELYNSPANKFVAGFLGSPAMNFFGAAVASPAGALVLETGSFNIELPPKKAKLLKSFDQTKVVVGIRPEDLVMVGEHVQGKTIPFTIDVVEPIGSETYVVGNAGEIPLIAGVGRNTPVSAHQDISLEPIVENIHLFDIRTEKAILCHDPE
jgi:multiple sugar transport system ATP-binding protein